MRSAGRKIFFAAAILVFASSAALTVPGGGAPGLLDTGWKYDAGRIRELGRAYPLADAIVLEESVEVVVEPDGRASRSHARRVALYTDGAIRRYADPIILFDSSRQELIVSTARVYMRDGRAVDTKKNGINQTTPFQFAAAPDYTGWQETVVTHVGIEKMCVAELVYTIKDKDPAWMPFSIVEHFGAADPVLKKTLRVKVPAGASLRHSSFNGAPEAAAQPDGTYLWEIADIPAYYRHGPAAWEGDYLPTVAAGLSESWDASAAFMDAALREAAGESGRIADLSGKLPADDEYIRLRSLQKTAFECVRGIDPPFELITDSPRKASRIYDSGYAHHLDRAVITAAMLGEAGYGFSIILASRGRNWPPEAAAGGVIGRILFEVKIDGLEDPVLLDPASAEIGPYMQRLSSAAIIRCGGGASIERIPERDSRSNMSILELDLEPGEEGKFRGGGRAVMTGAFSPYHQVRGLGDEMKEFVESSVGGLFSGVELEDWNPGVMEEGRVEIGFTFTGTVPEAAEDGRIYLSVPDPFGSEESLAGRVQYERSESDVPLRLVPCVLETRLKLEGFGEVRFPPEGSRSGAAGDASISVEHPEEGVDVLRRTLEFRTDFVEAADYGSLRSILLLAGEDMIIIKK